MTNNFYKEYYSALDGVTIIKFLGMAEDEFSLDPFPQFLCRDKNGVEFTIEISRDEEGNGGGFIFGLPLPNQEKSKQEVAK